MGIAGRPGIWPIGLTASVMPFESGTIDGDVVLDEQHRPNSASYRPPSGARPDATAVHRLRPDAPGQHGHAQAPLVVRRERLERLVATADGEAEG